MDKKKHFKTISEPYTALLNLTMIYYFFHSRQFGYMYKVTQSRQSNCRLAGSLTGGNETWSQIVDILLWEMGTKKTFKWYLKSEQTNKHTDIWTNRLIESIGPEDKISWNDHLWSIIKHCSVIVRARLTLIPLPLIKCTELHTVTLMRIVSQIYWELNSNFHDICKPRMMRFEPYHSQVLLANYHESRAKLLRYFHFFLSIKLFKE